MKFLKWLIGFLLLACFAQITACEVGDGIDTPPPATPPPEEVGPVSSYTRDVQAIFNNNCALSTCHGTPQGAPMQLEPGNSYANIVNQPTQSPAGGILVIPGNATQSNLFLRISGTSAGAQMPPGGPPLRQDFQDQIRDWINLGAFQDLTVNLIGMDPNLLQYMELRVVSLTRALKGNIILDPLPAATFSFFHPLMVPPGAHTLDFFADNNGSRAYDQPPTDDAWRENIPPTGIVTFTHNSFTTDIEAPPIVGQGDFTLNLSDMARYVSQLFELRVIKVSNRQTVGAYRFNAIPPTGFFPVVIPGIIENDQVYQVDFYADFSGNLAYDAPPADHAWRLVGIGDAAGLTLGFGRNSTFTDIDFLN